MNKGLGWPVVALVAIVVGAFVGIFALIPKDEPESRTMLLSAMVAASSAIVVWFVNRKTNHLNEQVQQVKELVNGNFSQVINKLPDPVDRELESRRQEERNAT